MSPANWIAILAIVVTVLITLGGALIAHIRTDEYRHTDLDGRVTRIEKDVGTHETGLRGSAHRHGNTLSWLAGCVWMIAEKVGIQLPKRGDE